VSHYVLSDFAKADQGWLDELLRGISDGAVALAEGDGARFMNAVALRMKPPEKPQSAAKGATPERVEERPEHEEVRSPLQKLMDKFR
jgi:PTH1 family peptidyl-tRNA hydrolase